jgi:hypothetical protein
MLRLSKLGPGRESYYLQTVGIEPAGEWMGHGSGQAGLGSQVGAQELSALLSGRDPFSGEVLGSGRNRVTVTGFDMTFAAPKSVSVLYGLGDQSVSDAVAEGHKSAVSAALRYVEDRALGVRRGSGPERTVERLEGAFGAAFLHRTSRALDPHLHSGREGPRQGNGPEAGDRTEGQARDQGRRRREKGRGASQPAEARRDGGPTRGDEGRRADEGKA